jgi:hypothetical protein
MEFSGMAVTVWTMTSAEHSDSDTAAPADPPEPPPPASPARPGGWRNWFASPLRAALVAIVATFVLVAVPCAIGAFVVGAAVGSHGRDHGDRVERRIFNGGFRDDAPGGPRMVPPPGFEDHRQGPGKLPPPPTVAPPTVIPAPSATS